MSISYHRIFVIRLLCILGSSCAVALWLYESRLGIITTYDAYAYPALVLLFLVSFCISFIRGDEKKYAEYFGLFSVTGYFWGASFKFFFDADIPLYIVANTVQWLAVVVTAYFVVFTGRSAAFLATIMLFGFYSPLIIRIYLSGILFWEPGIGAIIFNAMAVDCAILVSLTTVQKLRSKLTQNDLALSLMTEMAYFDNLTGARTRTGLEVYLNNWTVRDCRLLALVDLDNLKLINDTNGHDVGDRALSVTAQSLKQMLPDNAVISRWGGDEFLFISGIPEGEEIDSFLNAIHKEVCESIKRIDKEFSVSIGATIWNSAEQAFSDRFRHADVNLYEAKRNGKAAVIFKES